MNEIDRSDRAQGSADRTTRAACPPSRSGVPEQVPIKDPLDYGQCPFCGDVLVPADNLLWCRCPTPMERW
jgi:hypothetical protein